ncbi:tetratricopeptide repeat protein [Steroidobacter sp. S1-65]|uniref:Tetratricopeptide repeat protein n=1 Tax=Steroidobacter gossypii TaxID=2805490 RepID=A0ABS1X3I6_9GAMM|nr:serine/threonine-protein kinase [Steroidobacter gossypii]MBM0107788.1 tetratricopeptide repeat protein [Steroidobacter gossypii]
MTVPSAPDERWKRIGNLFANATKLQRAEREAFVRDHASNPEELRELLDLVTLAITQHSSGPISRAIGEAFYASSRPGSDSLVGRVVGPYQLVSVLGRGGSGTVYLGERADQQYSARVALKIIDASAAAAFGPRFRAERQILASLNHPNIARLLDAGETEQQQPYLVMEYVHGETVDQYCDRKQLDLRSRLQLFLQVCGAVQYAHQNLIVHRDLKPANILVTGEGTPKLLDFGIAKLLDASDLTKPSDLTRMNDRLLTPEYASPEQILGKPVTTVSDVYSLGVVLYQLLTGLRPYTLSHSAASQLELERAICVTDPTRPSAAVHGARNAVLKDDEPSIFSLAAARGTTPDKLGRSLNGDLDAIVMRALRKEPELRYNSVEQLIADIQRHLSNEPVQARQGNWVYYTNRFVRRNRLAVAASVSFMMFLIGVSAVMSIQRSATQAALELATQEKERAERVSGFMRNMFAAADPFVNFGKEQTARDVLDQASRSIETDLDEQPEVRAPLMETIGLAYRRMGLPDRAVPQLESALRLQRQLQPGNNPRTAELLIELAIALREAGQFQRSDQLFSEAQQMAQLSGEVDPYVNATLLVEHGRLENLRSNTTQAHQSFVKALELMRIARGPRHEEVGSILSELANILAWADDLAGAEKAAREAVDIYRDVAELHPDRIKADYHLAEILLYQGRVSEAAPIFERTLTAQRLLYKSNSKVADTLASLAQVRMAQGNPLAAESFVREALAAHHDSGSTAYGKIGYLQTMLGTVLIKQNKFADAENVLRDTLDLFAKSLPPDHEYVASAEHYLGEALAGGGKLTDAEALFTAAMNRWKRTDAPEWRSARSASALGEILHREGRTQEAERYLLNSVQVITAANGVDRETVEKARERLSRFYTETNQSSKLDAMALAPPTGRQSAESPSKPKI